MRKSESKTKRFFPCDALVCWNYECHKRFSIARMCTMFHNGKRGEKKKHANKKEWNSKAKRNEKWQQKILLTFFRSMDLILIWRNCESTIRWVKKTIHTNMVKHTHKIGCAVCTERVAFRTHGSLLHAANASTAKWICSIEVHVFWKG